MKFFLTVFSVTLVFALVSCKPLAPEVTSQDCLAAAPASFTRIFIGMPARGASQSGTSFDDPLDGSTAAKLDTILRSIVAGQNPTWGAQRNIASENLIVCLASGTFLTEGQYDWTIGLTRSQDSVRGFTVGKNWKIHGSGTGRTTLRLASFVPDNFVDIMGTPFTGGRNVAIGTHSEESSGVEVSDLTIDANHDHLTAAGGLPLNLAGIVLQSRQGGHWIHDVNITGGSGDAGFRNINYETFAIRIWGTDLVTGPQASTKNVVENVAITKPGTPIQSDSPPGGAMDGISVNNVGAEIRNNVVERYFIGYGGWAMENVQFHDNISRDTYYGFNADSFNNSEIILQSNHFIHPLRYGMVIGGGTPDRTFDKWNVVRNVVTLNAKESTGIILQGQVRNSAFTENTIALDGPARDQLAISSYSAESGLENLNNSFQDNHLDKALKVDFSHDPNFNSNCRFQNRDLQGNSRQDFPDNSSGACR
jgi:hypothetical protein